MTDPTAVNFTPGCLFWLNEQPAATGDLCHKVTSECPACAESLSAAASPTEETQQT